MYKLMIVDDSDIIRRQIERAFNQSEFDIVATASSGQDALQKFMKYHPQLITMDITMPGVSGLECIESIYALDPKVNILVVSALSDKMTGLRALDLGARGILFKPIDEEKLKTTLLKMTKDL